MIDPLDRPAWASLSGAWAPLARIGAGARRLDPAFGPFAAHDAGADPAALAPLAADGELWLVEATPVAPPPGLTTVRQAELVQMVATRPVAAPDVECLALGRADAAEMQALADLTRPGPFGPRTHELGSFIGVRAPDGRLVAMAGERMRVPGHAEVSGVCTHPEARGQGHAATLSALIAARIQARGEVPFLHCYPGNLAAVRLYEVLGFAIRRPLWLTVLAAA